MSYVHEGPNLYLAADEETIVPEGDPRAAYLLAATGSTIPDDIAQKHGLDKKAKVGPANKLRVGAEGNKGSPMGDDEIGPHPPRETLLTFPEQEPASEADVTFTPAPAFEEAVNEEAVPRRRGRTAQ